MTERPSTAELPLFRQEGRPSGETGSPPPEGGGPVRASSEAGPKAERTSKSAPAETSKAPVESNGSAASSRRRDRRPSRGRSDRGGKPEGDAGRRGGSGERSDEGEGGGRRRKPKRKRRERKAEPPSGPPFDGAGLLEISNKGFGFLRHPDNDFNQAPNDIFVTPELVRNFGLRDGMWIKCEAKEGHRGPQLTELREICGLKPEKCRDLPYFEELTAINPNKRLVFETEQSRYTTRVIDLIAPIGRGQRGLIVAPPRTGKTTLLQHLAEAVHANYEQMKVFVLLVDERPEEVTELRRALPFAEVMASSNDQDVKSHTRIAQLAIERSKRLVEAGEHVFLLLDSITRMARAFNNAMSNNKGGISKGGLAVGALEIPRRLFAAARNTREAGSLTIIGTALVETNSKMDDSIFQEFKGTGNMELVLERKIAEQYVWPAVNIHASGTRREELLLPKHQLEKIYLIRRGLAGHKPLEAMERILSLMERFPNNAQMLMELKPS